VLQTVACSGRRAPSGDGPSLPPCQCPYATACVITLWLLRFPEDLGWSHHIVTVYVPPPRDNARRAIPAAKPWGSAADSKRYADRTRRRETPVRNEQAAPETKGVTVKLLSALDLGPEIEGMAGRQLRMRLVTIEPGGVFGPIHDHRDRPGMVYILQGMITDHRDGVAREYGPGVGWPEDGSTTHWLENRGATPAVEISVDIVRQ
jgi:quercetin dioxygenase-like cupin family protein